MFTGVVYHRFLNQPADQSVDQQTIPDSYTELRDAHLRLLLVANKVDLGIATPSLKQGRIRRV